MKRGQQLGIYTRGSRIRKELKQAVTRAERAQQKQQIKKDPEKLPQKGQRRFYGYDD